MSPEKEGHDLAIFQILANELPETDPKQTARKIRLKLERSNLGEFDPDRVQLLRQLTDELVLEFKKSSRSEYAVLKTDPTDKFADPKDFDVEGMERDFHARYPAIGMPDMIGIIAFALYFYYLR